MNPVVLHLIPCDEARPDPDHPDCIVIRCIQGNITSLSDPPYPFRKELVCVYVALTELRGVGRAQVRVALIDESGSEVLLFGSPERVVDNRGGSPLDVHGFVFRIVNCPFPREGDYIVQFCYNGVVLERRPIRLK